MLILAELVHLTTDVDGIEAGYGLRLSWGVEYAVRRSRLVGLRSPQGLAKMMEVIVEVCRAFALAVSAKTETMCMPPPPRKPQTMVRVKQAGQNYKQVQSLIYLGGAVTETTNISVEIAMRTRAWWMRVRWYLCELYDQLKVAFSLETRMIKAE